MSEPSEQNLKVNGRSNLRRSTSEGAHMNSDNLKNGSLPLNGLSRGPDNSTDDEWSRASSEDRSEYGVKRQSTDDLDKKVSHL